MMILLFRDNTKTTTYIAYFNVFTQNANDCICPQHALLCKNCSPSTKEFAWAIAAQSSAGLYLGHEWSSLVVSEGSVSAFITHQHILERWTHP